MPRPACASRLSRGHGPRGSADCRAWHSRRFRSATARTDAPRARGPHGAGGLAWPDELSPQQAMVPLDFTPQAKPKPALTDVKLPDGGVAWPELLQPQQAMVPLVFTPQAYRVPALTDENVPVGGVASP